METLDPDAEIARLKDDLTKTVHTIDGYLVDREGCDPETQRILNACGLPLAEKISNTIQRLLIEQDRRLGEQSKLNPWINLSTKDKEIVFNLQGSGRENQNIHISYRADATGIIFTLSRSTPDGQGGTKFYIDGEFHVSINLDRTGNIANFVIINLPIVRKMTNLNGIYASRQNGFRADDGKEILEAALSQLITDMDSATSELLRMAGLAPEFGN